MSIPSSANADPSSLLEHLPAPCLFVAHNRTLVYANKAARQLPAASSRGNSRLVIVPDRGSTILNNQLLAAFGLPASDILELYLQRLEQQASQTGWQNGTEDSCVPPAVVLPAIGKVITTWTLAYYESDSGLQFSLTAPPALGNMFGSRCEQELSTEEKDWAMLQNIVEPTMNTSNFMCSIMSARQTSHKLNKRGQEVLSGEAQYPWTRQASGTQFENILMDSAFTRTLPADQGAAITSLTRRQALLNLRRGLANTRSGERTVFNATTVLLNKPHTSEPLGVIVCVEPEEFSLYLQRYDNMNHITPSINLVGDWNRARLVRSITLEGHVDFVSAAWNAYTGMDHPATLHNTSWFDVIYADDRNKIPKVENMDPATAHDRECEIRIRGRDGLYRWFSDRTEPFFDEDGHLVRWYSISDDIHDLVIKREKAHSEKVLLDRIFADLDVVFFEVDPTYIVKFASGTMQFDNLTTKDTYNSQAMLGVNLLDFLAEISPGGIPELRRCLLIVMNGESSKEVCEYAYGSRFIRTILVAQTSENHLPHSVGRVCGIVGTSIDITAAKEFSEVKAQMQAMETTNRLKSQFLANVSHELRTPIAGFIGLVELLLETQLDALQKDYLQCIQSTAHSLLHIVNDILDFSRAEAAAIIPESIPFNLSRFIEDVSRSNQILAAKKGLLFLATKPEIDVQLLGDIGRIRQILHNLITNAIKFTSHGYVKLSSYHRVSGDLVRLEFWIEDSGIGIDKQDLDKLFLPFVQADQSTTRIYGGSGLGLSIARKMAEVMGGSVSLESTKGQGTKAKLVLHLAAAPTQNDVLWRRSSFSLQLDTDSGPLANAGQIHELSPQQKSELHILFVEDNEINRKVILAHLSALGFHRVHAAKNGVEAVDYVVDNTYSPASAKSRNRSHKAHSPSARPPVNMRSTMWPDLIIMDCQMPVMDGYEATKKIRSELHYDRPVIALTASAIAGDRENCLDAGMDDHVAKPVSRQQLADIINKWALTSKSSLLESNQNGSTANPG